MFSKHQKRVCRMLPVEDKLELIKRINRGEKMGDLAIEYGIGRTTIHDIYKNRAKIQEYSEAKIYRISKRQSLRRGKHPHLEEALYEWYLHEKKTGTPVTQVILMTRAKEIYKEIFNTDEGFPSTHGWLIGFKRRYKIKFTQDDDIYVNDNENGPSELDEFKNIFFRKVIDFELCPSQVYVVTENELCWRIQPSYDFNKKLKKDKIDFLCCTNASGLHKLKLLLVGNKSRDLENANIPVHYFGQKIPRATEESYKTWFYECFVTETRNWLTEHNLPPKALLIVDQSLCNSHNITTDDGCVSTLFYPSVCKNAMPLNGSVMKPVKQSYKRHLLLTASSRNMAMDEYMKQFNARDFVFTLAESWETLTASKIVASWKTLWDNMILDIEVAIDDSTNDQYDSVLLRSVADDVLFSVDVLRKWLDGKDDHVDKNNEILQAPDDIESASPIVSLQDAVSSFDKCIQWAEQNMSACEDIAILRRMRDAVLISKQIILPQELVDEAEAFDSEIS